MVICSVSFLVCLSSLVFFILLRKLRNSNSGSITSKYDVVVDKNGGKKDEEVDTSDGDENDIQENIESDRQITEELFKRVTAPVYETKSTQHVYKNDKNNNKNNDGELCDVRLSVFINYLNRAYWKHTAHPVANEYTRDNLKPVMRLSKSRRKIHIVYSKNTLMKLAFSSNLNRGVNERFAFIFKGLKSWSVDETRGRFSDVMQDLLEFRQDIYRELMSHRNGGNSLQKYPYLIPFIKPRPSKISGSESILPVFEDPRSYSVACEREQLSFVNEKNPFKWKEASPRGLELMVPSVCFVIPFREKDVPGLTSGIEIQYKHLLSQWNNDMNTASSVKHQLTSSKVGSLLKILKPILNDTKNVPRKLIEIEENILDQNLIELEKDSVENLGDLDKTFDDIVFPDAIPMPGDAPRGRDMVDEPPCTEDKITVYEKEPDMKFDDDGPVKSKFGIESEKVVQLSPISTAPITQTVKNTKLEMRNNADRCQNLSRDIISEVNCLASINDLLYKLEKTLDDLKSHNQKSFNENSISQNVSTLHDLHSEFYSSLYPEYRNLVAESSQTESSEIKEKMKLLIERWKLTNFTLNEHSDRLNNAEVVIICANKLDTFLTHVEWILISQHGITANYEDIQKQHIKLIELSNQFDSSKNSLEKLQRLMGSLRDVELSEVGGIVRRWERALIQVRGRKEKIEEIQNKVLDFREALTREIQWLESVYRKLESEEDLLESISEGGAGDKKIELLLTELTCFDDKLSEHRKPIQNTFYKAEGLILSSKAYENDLKEFSFVVNECVDESCRYFIADQSREWIASNAIKLSQLYELILTELSQKINLLLSALYQDVGDNLDNDNNNNNNNELGLSIVYNGDNDTSFWELDKLVAWINNKELEFSQNMPSYNSVAELNGYVSNLQNLIDSIDKNENWFETTLNSVHKALNLPPSVLSRPVRESILLKTTTLEIRWSKLQWDIEGCHARLIPLQKLLLFYEKLFDPFQTWIEKVENQSKSFDILSASSFNENQLQFDPDLTDFENVKELSLRHERFLNDVMHHTADLIKLNRYGNMLISLAKDLQVYLSGFPDSMSSGVDGTGQIWDLQRNLYGINGRYKTTTKNLKFHGEIINEFLQKLEDFSKKVTAFLPWLNRVEHEIMAINVNNELSPEQIAMHREQILNFHSDIENHSDDIIFIKMASYYLSVWLDTDERDDSKNSLFGMWASTTDSIVRRYKELYNNINQKRSQLQILYITRPVCNDVFIDMLQWVKNSQDAFVKMDQKRDKNFLYQQIKLIKMVSLEAQYRQASVELLLEQRIFGNSKDGELFEKNLLHVLQMLIDLRLSVVAKRELCLTTLTKNVNVFGKWLNGVLHHLKSMNVVLSAVESFEKEVLKTIENLELQRETFLLINLCEHGLTPLDTQQQSVNKLVANLNTTWREVAMELITKRTQLNEVFRFKQIYEETFHPLLHWLEKMEECSKVMTPVSIHPHVLIDQLMEQKVLVNDAYSYDSNVEIHSELAESALYNILCKYLNGVGKQPVPIELEIRNVRDRYERILSHLEHRGVHLKLTYTRLEEYKAECDNLNDWFKHKAYPIINCSNHIAEDLDSIVKQYVAFLRFDGDLERVMSRVQNAFTIGREIVAGKTDVDGATFITKQNDTIKQKWDRFKKSYSIYQREIDGVLEKTFHRRHKNILLSLKMMINEASDISRTKNEAIIVKSVRDLCLDITQYEPCLNTLYQAAELLIQRGKCDLSHINRLVNELDECCKKLDYLLKTCDHFNEKISFDITSDELKKNMKEKTNEELNKSAKLQEQTSFQNPFSQEVDPVCLSNQWSWIGRNTQFSQRACPRYGSLQSTVERHTRVARSHVCAKLHKTHKLVDYLHDPCATFEDEKNHVTANIIDNAYTMPTCVSEQTVTSVDGSKCRKITTTDVTRQERRILRRRYYDAHGNECVEEIEIPDEKRNIEILDEQRWVDDGASVFKSPEEDETTTEEKYIRDDDGNITQWIVKKQIRRTKRTRIVKRLDADDEIDINANSQISIVPESKNDKMIAISSNELLAGKSSMSIQLDKLIQLYNARKKYVTFLKKNIRSIDDVTKLKAIAADSRLLCNISNGGDNDEMSTIMRINPYFVHRLFVSRVVPSIDRFPVMPRLTNSTGQNIILNDKELMNLSASIHSPYLNDVDAKKKFYQGIKMKCIKSPNHEEEHICPEHNLIETKETEESNYINGITDESHSVNSKRKGFRLIIQPSEKDSVVYEGENNCSTFRVKPHSKGKLIVKDIISSPDNTMDDEIKYDCNKNISNGGNASPSISLHVKSSDAQKNDKSIKVHATNSCKTHVKASLTQSSSDVTSVAPNTSESARATISMTIDTDGNHEGDQQRLDEGCKRFRKITVIPSSPSSRESRDQNFRAKLRFKSSDIHAIVLKHPSKFRCKSETVTMDDVSYEETDIVDKSEIIEETTTHHNVTHSSSSSFSSGKRNGMKNKERISYSNTVVTKTETVDKNDKTLVHIKVESKNENRLCDL